MVTFPLGAKKFWKILENHPWPLLSNRVKRCHHVAEAQGIEGRPPKRISYCHQITMNEKRNEALCKGNPKHLSKQGSVKDLGSIVDMIL